MSFCVSRGENISLYSVNFSIIQYILTECPCLHEMFQLNEIIFTRSVFIGFIKLKKRCLGNFLPFYVLCVTFVWRSNICSEFHKKKFICFVTTTKE